MKKILVISGKGGTGKTFFTASLACLAGNNKVMVDCDVDAANLHLLLHPDIKKSGIFKGGYEAEINKDRCVKCGRCIEVCRFEAIKAIVNKDGNIEKVFIDPFSCEGCSACKLVCPANAISLEKKESGKWFISDTKYGPFIFAKLDVAAENSGKLVSEIKEKAHRIGEKNKAQYIIIDGPPGIGCPVISSMSGIDLAVVVTEPTLSGISDMKRVIQVAEYFKVETKVVINKYDLNLNNSKDIENLCKNKDIEILGRIPFSLQVAKSIVESIPYIEFSGNDIISKLIRNMWAKISSV